MNIKQQNSVKKQFDVLNRHRSNIMFCIKFRENMCVKQNFE